MPSGRRATEGGRAWRETPVLAALAAVVAGAVWLAVLAAPEPPGERSVEAGFARDMGVHHAQAVEIAELARSRTADPEVQAVAADMVLSKQEQARQFAGWLAEWGVSAESADLPMAWMGHPTEAPMPGLASPAEMATLASAPEHEVDRRFLQMIIPHHRGGVLLARAALARTERREVVELATTIAESQAAEVSRLEALLIRKGLPPVTSAVTMPVAEADGHDEGFFGSAGSAFRSTTRLLPVAVGVFAAGWLVADGVRRHRARAAVVGSLSRRPPRWLVVTSCLSLALAGLVHLGLAPEHFRVATSHGWFFVVAGVGELVAAAALLGSPGPATYVTAGVVAVALVAVYVLLRIVPLPGGDEVEGVEIVGVITQYLQLAAAAVCTAVVRRQ